MLHVLYLHRCAFDRKCDTFLTYQVTGYQTVWAYAEKMGGHYCGWEWRLATRLMKVTQTFIHSFICFRTLWIYITYISHIKTIGFTVAAKHRTQTNGVYVYKHIHIIFIKYFKNKTRCLQTTARMLRGILRPYETLSGHASSCLQDRDREEPQCHSSALERRIRSQGPGFEPQPRERKEEVRQGRF